MTREEAIIDIYRRLRPGDPPTIETGTNVFNNLFFNPDRYDLSRVGRLKVNHKLGLDVPLDETTLRKEDILLAVRYLVELKNGTDPEKRIDELLSTRRYAVSIDAEMSGEAGLTLATLLTDDDQLAVPDSISEGNLTDRLQEVMEVLPERERLIVVRRFGLDGNSPETLGEIAEDLGITAERVRQLQNAALERLKKPGLLKRLADFV